MTIEQLELIMELIYQEILRVQAETTEYVLPSSRISIEKLKTKRILELQEIMLEINDLIFAKQMEEAFNE